MKRSNRKSIIAATCALLAVAGTDWYGAASLHASGTCGAMDVAFVIDTTGSMGGAIAKVKEQLGPIMDQIQAASGGDYRLGLVTFKDTIQVDEDFAAGNRASVAAKIAALVAAGGGGEPEASDEALNTVINGLSAADRSDDSCFVFNPETETRVPVPCQAGDFTGFDRDALKVVILITDAHPGGFDDRFRTGPDVTSDDVANAHQRAVEAAAAGIKISAIFVPTCSAAACEGSNATIRTIMEDYAATSGGVFKETNADGTGTDAAITDIIAACGAGETCNEDGSPNDVDEDDDGIKDEGCFVTKTLHFTPQFPSLVASFAGDSKLGNVRDHSLKIDHMFGVLATAGFDATVKATIEDRADMAFSTDLFGERTECSLNKLDPFETSEEPCVRYEVLTDAVAGRDYGAGDRAVRLTIKFFQPDAQKEGTDPVMGYTHGVGTFDQSILDHAIFPPGEDPEGVGYVDTYGSTVIMGVTPRPEGQRDEACHVDGTPNGIDEDGDGVIDEGCAVARSAEISPEDPSETYQFNDLGNTKPSAITVDHVSGVTAPFNLTLVATIVDPNDLSFVAPGFPGPGRTVCASTLLRPGTAPPDAPLPCVQYELLGPDGAPYNHGDPGVNNDGVAITVRYFAPESQAATQVAGMGYSDLCNKVFDRNILFAFTRFPGDSDPNDPEGVGYVDTYGSCVVMTATEPAPLMLDVPDDITVLATSAAGAAVSFTAVATGVINGVLTSFEATCNPPSGSVFAIGEHTVNCSATDSAGQTVTGSFKVNVIYGICALYDTERPKKAGSTVPIKLNLCDASGNNLSSPSVVLHAVSLTYGSGNAQGEPEAPGNSQPDNNFRFTSPSYHFNLKTTGLATGQWTLDFTVGGSPTVYSTPFAIK